MRIFNIFVSKNSAKYERNEIILKPFYAGFGNKKKTFRLNCFNRNRLSPCPRYKGFSFMVDTFSNFGDCHRIELIILNWIASLRINTLYGNKKFEIFERRHSS